MHTDSLFVTDYLHLSYRPDLAMLVVRWLRAASFGEVQQGFLAAREMSYRHEAARWLIDVRRRGDLNAGSSSWVATTLLPAVAAETLTGPLCIAYLLSPERASMLQQDQGMRAATTVAQTSSVYQLQLFMEEGEATGWLLNQ